MTLNKLCSELARREGKKTQARIGDIREMMKHLVEIHAEYVARVTEDTFMPAFLLAVEKRAAVLARKAKKKSK